MKAFYVEEVERAVSQAYAEKRDTGVVAFPWSDDPSDFTGQDVVIRLTNRERVQKQPSDF